MPGIPETKKKRFYEKSWFLELLGIPSALIAGVPTLAVALPTLLHSSERSRGEVALAWTGVAGVVLLIVIGVVKLIQGYAKDKIADDTQRLDGLHAALHVIHSVVRHNRGFSRNDRERLRVTIHRVVKAGEHGGSPDEIEQLLNYVGGKGGGAGRRFSVRSGITGQAVREGSVLAGSRNNNDHEAYIRELVADWGYTEEDAKRLAIGRNSWMAVPIKYKGSEVTGVVYLDSDEKKFFTDEIKTLIVGACGGLAVFIDERYS